MANEFLVSVADVILRDSTTGNALAYGKANISSAFTLSMQAADVRAGINNPLIYSYYHTRELSVKVEQAIFGETILALNVGANASTGAVNVLQTDCVTLASGSAYVSATPIGDVSVLLPNGSITTVSPSGSAIYVDSGGNQVVTAIYVTSKSADQIVVGSTTPPSIVDLTLIAEIRASDQSTVKKYLQINVPRFQVAGNYTLNLAANGVSQESLEGKALVSSATDCTSGDYYAKITYVPVTGTASYASIAAIPATMTFVAGASGSQQITLLGIRGGVYSNTNITASGSYVITTGGNSGSPHFSVTNVGLVAYDGAAGSGSSAYIKCTYKDPTSGSLFDYIYAVSA